MSHPECNLKIEYIYRTKLWQQICRGEQRSPVEETSPRLQPLQDRTKNYPITLVGAGAISALQKSDVPLFFARHHLCFFTTTPNNHTTHLQGTAPPTSRHLDSLCPPAWLVKKIQTSLLRAGCRGRQPLQIFGQVLPPQNRSALCVSTLRLGLERRCRFYSPISLSSNI